MVEQMSSREGRQQRGGGKREREEGELTQTVEEVHSVLWPMLLLSWRSAFCGFGVGQLQVCCCHYKLPTLRQQTGEGEQDRAGQEREESERSSTVAQRKEINWRQALIGYALAFVRGDMCQLPQLLPLWQHVSS